MNNLETNEESTSIDDYLALLIGVSPLPRSASDVFFLTGARWVRALGGAKLGVPRKTTTQWWGRNELGYHVLFTAIDAGETELFVVWTPASERVGVLQFNLSRWWIKHGELSLPSGGQHLPLLQVVRRTESILEQWVWGNYSDRKIL